jgi:hypothetical protein
MLSDGRIPFYVYPRGDVFYESLRPLLTKSAGDEP